MTNYSPKLDIFKHFREYLNIGFKEKKTLNQRNKLIIKIKLFWRWDLR